MPGNSKKRSESKRFNRAVGVGEAVGRLLDPALRRRGFATRDIIAHWKAMAPKPYDQVAMPDRLTWPRGGRGTEGATLYLRCVPGHGLALAHEGQMIAAAINRYFGYVLVGQVRLSPTPFSRGSPPPPQAPRQLDEAARVRLEGSLAGVSDAGVRQALRRLGTALARKPRSNE
jgi:hypothetical protein